MREGGNGVKKVLKKVPCRIMYDQDFWCSVTEPCFFVWKWNEREKSCLPSVKVSLTLKIRGFAWHNSLSITQNVNLSTRSGPKPCMSCQHLIRYPAIYGFINNCVMIKKK
ncbi:hypothetical protein SO802_011932 [Lithocarpus litseifolius]|uniref:Uncharacterized protein n=1 Tax=Lithocarpus litseifolius TaxID=425828 RepID=A0AAW2D6S9_9ROSI